MMIIPTQNRYIDPFSDVSSSAVNNRLKGVFSKSKACLYGLMISNSGLDVTISKGTALKDYVVINFTEDAAFTVSETGEFYVVIKYNYEVSDPPPQAEIGYITEDILNNNPDWYVIIGTITSDGNTITSISYEERDTNPISEYIQDYFANHINADLNMHNFRIINLADPINDQDAVNKRFLNASIGEVKVDEQDVPDYLPQKIINGANTTVSIDTSNPSDKKLVVSAIDEFIKVESADSGKSFILK